MSHRRRMVSAVSIGTCLVTLAALAGGCVTADPYAPPAESVAVKKMRHTERFCREWVKHTLKGNSKFKEANYYYGQLPRESAKTYVVFFPREGNKVHVAMCDAERGKAEVIQEIAVQDAATFKREFDRRERALLAPHRQDLAPGEMSHAAIVVMKRDDEGKVRTREYWPPKHVEQDFNGLFYEVVQE